MFFYYIFHVQHFLDLRHFLQMKWTHFVSVDRSFDYLECFLDQLEEVVLEGDLLLVFRYFHLFSSKLLEFRVKIISPYQCHRLSIFLLLQNTLADDGSISRHLVSVNLDVCQVDLVKDVFPLRVLVFSKDFLYFFRKFVIDFLEAGCLTTLLINYFEAVFLQVCDHFFRKMSLIPLEFVLTHYPFANIVCNTCRL